MALKLRKLSYSLGAEVCEIDVGQPMSEAAFGEVYRAFLDHGILLFRNQRITRDSTLPSAAASASSTGTTRCRAIAIPIIPSCCA